MPTSSRRPGSSSRRGRGSGTPAATARPNSQTVRAKNASDAASRRMNTSWVTSRTRYHAYAKLSRRPPRVRAVGRTAKREARWRRARGAVRSARPRHASGPRGRAKREAAACVGPAGPCEARGPGGRLCHGRVQVRCAERARSARIVMQYRLWRAEDRGARLCRAPQHLGRGTISSSMAGPSNLLVVSDLHFGEELLPGAGHERRRAVELGAAAFCEFLAYYTARRSGGRPWRLVINGDCFDFMSVLIPATPERPSK